MDFDTQEQLSEWVEGLAISTGTTYSITWDRNTLGCWLGESQNLDYLDYVSILAAATLRYRDLIFFLWKKKERKK